MADLMPKNHNEVLITVSDKSREAPRYATRKLSLSAKANTRQIGRSSSRINADLSASPTNAWFDNAVMSREHAEIIWDSATQLVSIRDTGSLHGTSLNGFQLPPWTKKRVQVGDVLKFGALVEKEQKAFHPSEVQISSIDLGPPQFPLTKTRTNTFTVPDDSEPEEVSDAVQEENVYSDDDDGGVARSAMLVQQIDVQPVKTPEKQIHPTTIDLTEEPQGNALVNDRSPSLLEQTPSTTRVDHTHTTTFAPALRYQKSATPTRLPDTSLPAVAVESQSAQTECASPSDSLLGGILDDVCEVDEDPTILNLALPEAPSLAVPSVQADVNAASASAAQSRQKIVDRMALCNEIREKADHFTRASSFQENLTGLKQAQAAYCGQKRKFSDFALSEPDTTPSLSGANLSPYSQNVSLAQVTTGTLPADQPVNSTSDVANRHQAIETHQGGSSVTIPLAEPPRKRMRRVAEAMGYAALGGIAVMSALIATAPDF